ncbi:TPA: hypothetical protein TVB57_001509 [Streptococcus equi subsp. zooepidemicus]|nr:hypothetical protein [Streptococcus equi subsp. zooepidemicus]HEL1083121.1 hypothetical protein [Streptococcus equi subsp. zooepidemicus]
MKKIILLSVIVVTLSLGVITGNAYAKYSDTDPFRFKNMSLTEECIYMSQSELQSYVNKLPLTFKEKREWLKKVKSIQDPHTLSTLRREVNMENTRQSEFTQKYQEVKELINKEFPSSSLKKEYDEFIWDLEGIKNSQGINKNKYLEELKDKINKKAKDYRFYSRKKD